eukprot:SAG31_NODE_2613_length_5377_cov_16.760894_2_plen_75_part_00
MHAQPPARLACDHSTTQQRAVLLFTTANIWPQSIKGEKDANNGAGDEVGLGADNIGDVDVNSYGDSTMQGHIES